MAKWTAREIRTKESANVALDDLRGAVRDGAFDRHGLNYSTLLEQDLRLTFGDVVERYLEAYPKDPDKRNYLGHARKIEVPARGGGSVPLELKPLDEVTTADIEHVAGVWRVRKRRKGCAKDGAVGVRKMLQALRHLHNWAIKKGHAERSPFRREGVAVIEVRASTGRSRRLVGDEEERLLQAADPYTKDLIIAVLETGCRGGELRSLQWTAVRVREIVIEPAKAKSRRARAIPITKRLRAVLEMRRHAPDGSELPPSAYVFGDELGEYVKKGRAGDLWRATCKEGAGILDLHFHDLRREFGCRLMESGASAHETRDALGHSNLTMTNQYLSTSGVGLTRAFARFEEARQGAAGSALSDSLADRRQQPRRVADSGQLGGDSVKKSSSRGDSEEPVEWEYRR